MSTIEITQMNTAITKEVMLAIPIIELSNKILLSFSSSTIKVRYDNAVLAIRFSYTISYKCVTTYGLCLRFKECYDLKSL